MCTQSAQQIQYKTIEFLRFFCAAFVVLRHASIYIGNSLGGVIAKSVFANGITEICVPTFFIISGFLFFKNLNNWDWSVYKKKVFSRTKTLLLPYIVWNIISLVISYALLILTDSSLSISEFWVSKGGIRFLWDCGMASPSYNFFGAVLFFGTPADGPLWFIRDLMILVIISPILHWCTKTLGFYWIILTGLFYITRTGIPYVGFAPAGIFYFSLGAFLQIHYEHLFFFFYKNRVQFWIMTFLLLFILVVCDLYAYDSHKYVSHIFAPIGSIGIICLVANLYERNIIKEYKKLSHASFMIFALHGAGLLGVVGAVFGKLPFSSDIWNVVQYLLVSTITIGVCVIIDIILCQHASIIYGLLTGFRKNK